MSKLFKKAAIFTDLHLGLKNNSETHNLDCLNFVKWFIEQAKLEGCETAIVCGDYHNNRATISILTLNYSMQCIELLNAAFDVVYMINGNHDTFYKANRSVHSVAWGKYLPNVQIVNDIITDGDVTLCPWMVGDEFLHLNKVSSKYLFGHLELPHFMMNSMVLLPEHEGGAKDHHFETFENVFSGHFHKRQTRSNITYIGNAFAHNFGDTGDTERGMMIVEWGCDPVYRAWTDQPTYHVLKLSNILADTDRLLLPNSYNRVIVDVELSYEEANFLRETLTDQYKLREMSMMPQKKDNSDIEQGDNNIQFEGVDQLVTAAINNIDSKSFDRKKLLEIYQNL